MILALEVLSTKSDFQDFNITFLLPLLVLISSSHFAIKVSFYFQMPSWANNYSILKKQEQGLSHLFSTYTTSHGRFT